MSDFFKTPMGKNFFEHHVPRAVKALETIARKLPAPEKPEPPEAPPPDGENPVDLWKWAATYVALPPEKRSATLYSVAVQVQQRLVDELRKPEEEKARQALLWSAFSTGFNARGRLPATLPDAEKTCLAEFETWKTEF